MENPTTKKQETQVSVVVENPTHEKEFNYYVAWKAIPRIFRTPPTDKKGHQMSFDDYMEKLGIDEGEMRDLMEIRTQTEFAERYELSLNTLTAWNKTIKARNLHNDYRKWCQLLAKNVLAAMYANGISNNLNSDRDRLNFLKYSGYVEKSGIEHSADETLTDVLKKALDERRKRQLNSGSSEPIK